MDEIEKLLFDFVELYNHIKENMQSSQIANKLAELKMDYYQLVDNGVDIYAILDKEFAEDSQLYILVLSTLFFAVRDSKILDKAEMLLCLDELPVDVSLRIQAQIAINRFSNGFSAPEYSYVRKLHQHLLQRLEKELRVSWEYIPYSERNHKLIVLETDTLLVNGHAPSITVMSIYNILKYEMGYDVLLIVDFLRMDLDDMENYWVFPFRAYYLPKLNGDYTIEFHGKKIFGYQQVIWGNDVFAINNSLDIIYEKKPEFVWHIGGQSVLSEFFGKITTLVSMPCSKGYPVSEASILIPVGVEESGDSSNMAEKAYIEQRGQKIFRMQDFWEVALPRKKYQKTSFGFLKEDFVIAVVGNRLEDDINDTFIQIMEKIAEKESRCKFLIIGEYKKEFLQKILRNRVKKLGYQKDLAGVLAVSDLFLNPVRAGGGSSAVIALSVNVPVITLPSCDVAFNAGGAFVCDSLQKIPDLIWDYCNNTTFYQSQVEECKKRYRKLISVNPADECGKLIRFVAEQVQEMESLSSY